MLRIRTYEREKDYELINKFIIEIYRPKTYVNWLQPRWERMHFHPDLNEEALEKIGIFEDDGKIVAVVTCEHDLGEAYFLVHPKYNHLKPKLFQYAEDNLGKRLDTGKRALTMHIKDNDKKLEKYATRKRYTKDEERLEDKYNSIYPDDKELPKICLPEGFSLKSLEEENDLNKVHHLLWRGYNQEGKAPEDGIERRNLMQSAPNFNKALQIVAIAPNGDYAAYSGIWFESVNKTAYIEPVCTDPKYRRLGLGKACVLECIKRVRELGAKEIFAESGQAFYQAIGFELQLLTNSWYREYQ